MANVGRKIIKLVDSAERDRSAAIIKRMQAAMKLPHGSPAEVWDVTPGVAQYIMTHHHDRNRAERAGSIKRFASVMKAEDWLLNGETVVFDSRGQLANGQHRFQACIRSGVPFRTYIVFGVPPEYFESMDQGRPRSAADLLHLAGADKQAGCSAIVLAGALRWAELIATGAVKLRTVYVPQEILVLWESGKHRDVADWVKEARSIRKTCGQPEGMMMAMLRAFCERDEDLTVELCKAWGDYAFPERFRPFREMQNRIAAIMLGSAGRLHDVVRAAMIVNAWNAVRTGKGRIDWDLARPFPVIK